jgi:hypothetical protein
MSEEAELMKQDINEDPNARPDFGFGVPEERKELDPNQFEFEIDTKTAKPYTSKQKYDFNEEADAAPKFEDFLGEEDQEYAQWSKMPNSVDEINSLR